MYIIENISEQSLSTLKKALDLYLRIGLGQIEAVASVLLFDAGHFDAYTKEQGLLEYKQAVTGFGPGASYGIFNENIKECFKNAYELLNVLEERNTSLKKIDKEPIIKLKKDSNETT